MVAAVRRGASLRAVAAGLGRSVRTVFKWVRGAKGQRLDRVNWQDRPRGNPKPKNSTPRQAILLIVRLRAWLKHRSALGEYGAAAAALELFEELCGRAGANPDLAHPPVRILVVDDDPVARRAISGSIQLVFGRPDNAESGEAALALAAEECFDLIFLDVLMPGVDGFTACKKIHETALNCRSPVVFVTSQNDMDSRSQAVASGGCGFIPKPVLPSQITLTTLTFILRARLNEFEPVPALEET